MWFASILVENWAVCASLLSQKCSGVRQFLSINTVFCSLQDLPFYVQQGAKTDWNGGKDCWSDQLDGMSSNETRMSELGLYISTRASWRKKLINKYIRKINSRRISGRKSSYVSRWIVLTQEEMYVNWLWITSRKFLMFKRLWSHILWETSTGEEILLN